MDIVSSLGRQRKFLMLALPMILSNITIPMLGMVDTAVLGHLNQAYYLGGVAVGSMIISLIFWLCGFLRMSTTGLVAQAVGKGDHALARRQFSHSLVLALGLALVLLVVQWPLQQLAFWLAGGSEQIQYYGRLYFEIRIWSAPATLVNMVLLGWLLAHQQIRWVVLQLLVVNITNILLDVWLVVVLEWGVAGAAWASLVAEYTGMCLLTLILCRGMDKDRWRLAIKLEVGIFSQLFRLNRDIFIRSAALQGCFAFMTFQGARFGDVTVAANAILLNFLLFLSYGLDGFAYAAESMVGQAWGRRNRSELDQLVARGAGWCAVVSTLFALTLWGGGEAWIHLLTDLPAVRGEAVRYLPWIIAISLVAWGCFLMDGIYIGMTRAKQMRNSMLVASLGVFFPTWWLCQSWGNDGLWLAMLLFMLARGVSLAIDYYGFMFRTNGMSR